MLVLKQGRELAHKLCLINAAGTLLITIGVQHNPLAADFNDSFRNNLESACGTLPLGGNLSRVW